MLGEEVNELEQSVRSLAELKKKYNEEFLRMTARARIAAKEMLRKKYADEIVRILEEE